MLKQQILSIFQQDPSILKLNTKINKIQSQYHNFNDLIFNIRQKRFSSNEPSIDSASYSNTPVVSHQNQQSLLSDLQMKQSKVINQYDHQKLMDKTLKKIHNPSKPVNFQNNKINNSTPKDMDFGIKRKRIEYGLYRSKINIDNFNHVNVNINLNSPKPTSLMNSKKQLQKETTLMSLNKTQIVKRNKNCQKSRINNQQQQNFTDFAHKKSFPIEPSKNDPYFFKTKRNHQTKMLDRSNDVYHNCKSDESCLTFNNQYKNNNFQNKKQIKEQKNNSLKNSKVQWRIRKNLHSKEKQFHLKQTNQFHSNGRNLLKISPQKIILQFLPFQKELSSDSTPSQIFDFFSHLCQMFGIRKIEEPLIKRYRNCIYFGQKVPQDKNQHYYGFVWYYRRALYYGNFRTGRKDDQGIQIDFDKENHIWKGCFNNGTKTGYFQYYTPQFKFHGMMKNGYFHGQGLLQTSKSKYQGSFKGGMKSGYGQQIFQNGKISYKGQYIENAFQGEGQLQTDDYYYKGSFKNNVADGKGIEKTSQYQYSGYFKRGKKHGKGKIKMNNGAYFEGQFQNGKAVEKKKQICYERQNFRNSQQRNKKMGKKSHNTNQLYSLQQQNQFEQISTIENDHKRQKNNRNNKKPKYKQHEYNFPQDQIENQQDPLDQKIF